MHPIFKISGKVSPIFRRRRMKKFIDVFQPTAETRILDVGGLPRFWDGVPIEAQITMVNLDPLDDFEASFLRPNHQYAIGDGTRLEYPDRSFDIVFSNSVIEHLGTFEQQSAFAAESRRVGDGYWVQTPAKEFPVEPHYFTLFVHWLPKSAQRRLLRNFSLWGLLGRPGKDVVELVLAELRLLPRREFRRIFPDATILTERLFGVPKSYTAWRESSRGQEPSSKLQRNSNLQLSTAQSPCCSCSCCWASGTG